MEPKRHPACGTPNTANGVSAPSRFGTLNSNFLSSVPSEAMPLALLQFFTFHGISDQLSTTISPSLVASSFPPKKTSSKNEKKFRLVQIFANPWIPRFPWALFPSPPSCKKDYKLKILIVLIPNSGPIIPAPIPNTKLKTLWKFPKFGSDLNQLVRRPVRRSTCA